MNSFKRYGLFLSISVLGLLPLIFAMNQDDFELPQATGFVTYTHPDGLFQFEHRNDFEVRESQGITSLQHVSGKETIFQIFPKQDQITFSDLDYICQADICYSAGTPEQLLTNLEIKPELTWQHEPYEFLTRAETLEWLLTERHPEKDFTRYGDDCFEDTYSHPQAGYICYAKDKEIVAGIGNEFFPDSSINLFGFMKILFLTYGEDMQGFNPNNIDQAAFEMMTEHHYAHELLAKSYEAGLFLNPTGEDIWPNRNLYTREAQDIFDRFLSWRAGEVLRNSTALNDYNPELTIWLQDPNRDFTFREEEYKEDFKVKENQTLTWREEKGETKIYLDHQNGTFEYFATLPLSDASQVLLEYDANSLHAQIRAEFADGTAREFDLVPQATDFAHLKTNKVGSLSNDYLLPNADAGSEPSNSLTRFNIHLSETDFERINTNRTVNTHYPAHLEIERANGQRESHAIMIKTRGNASRGYMKSSYTLENLTGDFQDFNGHDELKLRSMINDEEHITEKLLYRSFSELGYPAPEFYEAIVTLNNLPMGLYQVTEPIDDDFFKHRDIDQDDYAYARNLATNYGANLSYYESDEITLDHYRVDGSEKDLIKFIQRLDSNDATLMDEIDTQNVFDFALFAFAYHMHDSMQANFYIYRDHGDDKWKLFFWDADNAIDDPAELNKENFKAFVSRNEYPYNNLVYFVFQNLSEAEFNLYWDEFMQRSAQLPILDWLDEYTAQYSELFSWDNALWNGRHFERKITDFDTLGAISEMRAKLTNIQKSMAASSNP